MHAWHAHTCMYMHTVQAHALRKEWRGLWCGMLRKHVLSAADAADRTGQQGVCCSLLSPFAAGRTGLMLSTGFYSSSAQIVDGCSDVLLYATLPFNKESSAPHLCAGLVHTTGMLPPCLGGSSGLVRGTTCPSVCVAFHSNLSLIWACPVGRPMSVCQVKHVLQVPLCCCCSLHFAVGRLSRCSCATCAVCQVVAYLGLQGAGQPAALATW